MLARWRNSVLALLLAITPAGAQEGIGLGGGFILHGQNQILSGATSVRTGTCVADDSNATTYNGAGFQAAGTGAVSATETGYIVVGVAAEDGLATFGINSMTVNGIAATEITDQNGTGVVDTAMYIVPVPLYGTTVNVSVTASEAITSMVICVWMLRNLQSITALSSVSDNDTASGALVLTTGTTNANGRVLAICNNSGVADSTTWAVLNEVEDTQSGEQDYSNAQAAGTGSSMSNTCDWTGTNDASGSAVAFR